MNLRKTFTAYKIVSGIFMSLIGDVYKELIHKGV